MALFRKKNGRFGLDIGSQFVKFVQIHHENDTMKLINMGIARIYRATENDEKKPRLKEISDTIRSMLKSSNIKTREVVIAVSSREVIVKRIEIDRMTESEVKQIIKWEAEQHIPFNIDEVYIDFNILDPEGDRNQMEILLVAGKKMNIEAKVEVAIEAGLQPVVVDVDAFAIQNAFELNYPEFVDDIVCLLNVGHEITVISLVRKGIPLFVRDIPFGNTVFMEKLRKGLAISREDAESYSYGILPEGVSETEAYPTVVTSSEDLVIGITRTFSYLKTLGGVEKPDQLYISGGGAKIPGLVQSLEDRLDIPIHIMNPLRRVEIRQDILEEESIEEISPILTQAVGLGLR